MTSAFSWQNSISLCPASFHIPKPNLPVTPGVSWLPPFAFQSPIMKRTCFFFFFFSSVQFSSVQFSRSVMSNALWSHESQHTSLSITNSQSSLRLMSIESVMPSSHLILCHPISFCPQSLPASGSFLMSWLFKSGGQSIGASASGWVLLVNIQGWFPLGLTSLISLQSKGLWRVFPSITIQKPRGFLALIKLSNSPRISRPRKV